MKDLGAQLSVSDLLSFPGVVENTKVFNMMAGADLVVVPSRPEFPEGTPLAMFGAIASRTPIVCSNHPMFQKLMVDGHNASGFRAGDYRDLGGAMKRVLSDPVLYAALSANAPLTWAG
jgi:glycosyltransferase involved in cell wall biosynthesis